MKTYNPVLIAELKNYQPGISSVKVIRYSEYEDPNNPDSAVFKDGDQCKIIINISDNCPLDQLKSIDKDALKNELRNYVKTTYYRQVFNCEFGFVFIYD